MSQNVPFSYIIIGVIILKKSFGFFDHPVNLSGQFNVNHLHVQLYISKLTYMLHDFSSRWHFLQNQKICCVCVIQNINYMRVISAVEKLPGICSE